MSDDTPALRSSGLVRVAGFALLFSGLFTAVAGFQIVFFLEVFGPARFVPWALMAMGAACMWAGSATTMGRFRAVLTGLVLALFTTALGAGWFAWAALNAVFSLLQTLSVWLCAGSIPLLVLALRPAWAYSQARKQLFDADHGLGLSMGGPPQSPWPGVIALTVTSALVSPLILAIAAPDLADRLWLRVERMSQFALPWSTGPAVERNVDYAYPWSPFHEYLSLEAAHVEFDTARAETWADDISDEVALRMLTHTRARDVETAERELWANGESQQIPLWIAEALRGRGVFYSPESLLSRSFDPDLHRGGGEVHLDCDQLAYLFLHVAARLDLNMAAVPSVLHMYLRYAPPQGVQATALTVETTAFRHVDIDGNHVDFLGAGIGEDFFIDENYHREGRGGFWATDELAQAAHLYEPADAEEMRDAIVANLAVGLKENGSDEDLRALLESELPGTHDYILVSNLHQWTLNAAQEALDAGELDRAVAEAQKAAKIRADYGMLVTHLEPEEALIEIKADLGRGDEDAAQTVAKAAMRTYRDTLGRDPWSPVTPTQRALVDLAIDTGLSPKTGIDG